MEAEAAAGRQPYGTAVRVVLLALGLLAAAPCSYADATAQEEFRKLAQQAAKAQHDGQEEQALRLYLKALEIDAKWAEGWRNAGVLLADRREFSRAEAAFKKLLEIDPKLGAGWALLGLCEYEQGRYDEAYRHIQKGLSLGVGNADLDNVASYHAALLLIRKGDFPNAQSLLTRVAKSGAQDPDLIVAFGLNALRITDPPDKLGPAGRGLVTEVGRIEYFGIHQPVPEVISGYEKLLTEHPRAVGLHYALGNFLMNNGHYERGLEEMQKELELTPDDLMTLLQIAMGYLKINQPERALAHAEKAVRVGPNSFAAHYALGWSLYKLGQIDRAIPELQSVIRLEPNLPQGHFALSQAYLRAHRKADADREREEFSRLKQEQPPAAGSPAQREASHTGP